MFSTWKTFLGKDHTHVSWDAIKSTSTHNMHSCTNSFVMILMLHCFQELRKEMQYKNTGITQINQWLLLFLVFYMSTGYFNFELYTVLAETLKRMVTRWQSKMCALSFHSQDLISSSVLTVFYRILGMLVWRIW